MVRRPPPAGQAASAQRAGADAGREAVRAEAVPELVAASLAVLGAG